MTKANQERIQKLEALLNGEVVDGLKMGDAGLRYDWIIREIATLRGTVEQSALPCLICSETDCLGDYTHFEEAA